MSLTEKELEYHRQYRKKNYERIRAYQKQWVIDNPDKVLATIKKWEENNKEKRREVSARHLKKHPEKNAERQQRRRAAMAKVDKFFILNKELNKLYSDNCFFCGNKENQTIDHKIPISRGGKHGIGNLQTLCLSCNSAKRHKTIMEWRMYLLRKSKGSN
jgi:5-methylcytosine-specific restriction endonuclease McrA